MKQLHGDGVHDDTDALQALADGEPVLMPDGRTVQQLEEIPGGVYLTHGIRLPPPPDPDRR